MTRVIRFRALRACAGALATGTLGSVLFAATATAQPALTGSPVTQTSATALVNFLWTTQPGVLTVIQKSRAKCSPGECFSQFVGVKANAGWQLQVKLMFPGTGFTVDLSTPTRPATAVARLSATAWTPVNVTGKATANQTNEVTFYGKKVTGPSGRLPTATDLALLLQYQVVRTP